MAPLIFRCPATGYNVQGWVADEVPTSAVDTYEGILCHACGALHMVNQRTAKVLGVEDE